MDKPPRSRGGRFIACGCRIGPAGMWGGGHLKTRNGSGHASEPFVMAMNNLIQPRSGLRYSSLKLKHNTGRAAEDALKMNVAVNS